MKNFYLQRKPVPESKREMVSDLFGHLTYRITADTFTLKDSVSGTGNDRISSRYIIESSTDSSVTLRLMGDSLQKVLTLYRFSEDVLFIKSGSNLEYFKRVAA